MSTIYRPLIGIYEYLTENLKNLPDYREVEFFGRYTTVVKCYVEVVFKDNGEVRAAVLPEPVKSLQFNKGRSGQKPQPFPFCENTSFFLNEERYENYKEICDKVFKGKELPKSIKAWLKAIPKVKDALLAVNLTAAKDEKNKKVKDPNIVFRYNGEATPLSERKEVFDFFTANNYALRHEWFEGGKKLPKVDELLVWYDVIDDKPLKLNEVHLSRPGCSLFGIGNVRIATFNDGYNDMNPIGPDYSALNFPMSKEHGSMIDAALDWLARYRYSDTKAFVFSYKERKFMWFPNLDACENLDFETFITKTSIMPSRMISLLSGRLPDGVSFDENGNVLSDDEKCPLEWLTDEGIMLYEIIQENRRCNFVERPFSLETIICRICKYNATNIKCGGSENHRNDFYRAFHDICPSDHLWKQYVNNHIIRGTAAPKEMLNRIRSFLMYKPEYIYDRKNANKVRALITELVKQHNPSFADITTNVAFASGRWCGLMSYRQYKLGLSQSFGKSHMESVYNGKTTIVKEIEDYLTVSEEDKKQLRLMFAKRYSNVRESRYHKPSTPFGTALHSLHFRYESEDIASSGGENKTAAFIGSLINTKKALQDAAPISSEAEKNAFIVGFYRKKNFSWEKVEEKA